MSGPVVPAVGAYAVAAPLPREEFVAWLRAADDDARRRWVRLAVATRLRRRRTAAVFVGRRLR